MYLFKLSQLKGEYDQQILLFYLLYSLIVSKYLFMQSKNNFKQMRKRVTCQTDRLNYDQNQPTNPTKKLSFRGIKKNIKNTEPITNEQILGYNTPKSHKYKTSNTKRNIFDSSRSSKEDCNKFSVLLQSKGYSNNNSAVKSRPQTARKLTYNENIDKNIIRNGKNDNDIQKKCRKIKQKNYQTSKEYGRQLNSLYKLKSKFISPLKQKSVSQPQNKQRQDALVAQFQHQSFQSQHDFVNISKVNDQSIQFDMSPVL